MNKDKIKDRYVHHRNLLNRGALELGAVNASILTTLSLTVLFGIPGAFAPICFIALLLIHYLLGLFYFKADLISKDYKWHTSNDPNINAIFESIYLTYERIKKLEEKLEEREKEKEK